MGKRGDKPLWLESEYDRTHPYPQFTGVATTKYYLVYIDLHRYKPDVPKEWLRGVPVWYRKLRHRLPHKAVVKLCNSKVIQLQAEYGEGSLWRSHAPCHYVEMWEAEVLGDRMPMKEGVFSIMYYCKIDGKMEGFKTARLRDQMIKICNASRKKLRVQIRYLKKGNKRLVTRDCAAYSYADGFLAVTDTRSGNTKIRSYIVDRIKAVRVLRTRFRDEYLLEL